MSICLAKQVFARLDIFAVGEFDIIVKKRFRYDINPRSRSEHIEHLRSKCYIELRTQHIENPHKRIYIDARLLTAGALHTLPVCREPNIGNAIKYLKNCGFRVVAATEKAKYTYTKANLTDPTCIVMGAEDKGIPAEHLALCDEWISIPQFGHIQSLNVSVAAGVLIYEAVRQRTEE